MIDRFLYRFFGLLDDFFDRFISNAQPPKKKKKKKDNPDDWSGIV